MPRIIAIMNQKGGVGKTTTTLNLGAALSQHGKRVLLVDLDPQANLTIGLGQRAADLSQSVYELLTDPNVDTARLVVKTQWDNLDLVPSHIDLSGAELEMVTMIGRETRLSKALAKVTPAYDYVLIDCLPSLSLLTVNAMAAAGEVFVPLQAHPFALEGLGKLFEVTGMIREAMNPALRVSGVLLTMFDGRTNVARETLDRLRGDARLREHIFNAVVKQNIKVAESQSEGVPVVFYDSSCHATKAYQALCLEVLEMERGALASECAERITERELKAGRKVTFTPDLMAPPPPANAADRETPSLPPNSSTHVAPVTALVGGNPPPPPDDEEPPAPSAPPSASTPPQPGKPPASMTPPAAEKTSDTPKDPPAPPEAEGTSHPAARYAPLPPNTPDVETLHPSAGHGVVINARA